jgi:RimJ/RimL family protein N-acetyltransferase
MILGNEIRLRAAEREDLSRFLGWINDPEVRSGLMLYLPQSMTEEEQWYERMIKAPAPEHALVIELLASGDWMPVGTCGFHEFDWRARCAEVGILIGEKGYWNRGFGTQVMRLLLRHGFNTLNLNRISLRVFANNPRAIRCYEKARFVHEGRQRQAYYQGGDYVDILMMSVIRSEWND